MTELAPFLESVFFPLKLIVMTSEIQRTKSPLCLGYKGDEINV